MNKLKKIIEFAQTRGWMDMGKADSKKLKEATVCNYLMVHPNMFLFNHDFAKAFWGTWESSKTGLNDKNYAETLLERWEYYLQQAVISKDPIDYYYKYA